ncbi:MAG: RtcB family protein [Pyramidobacter sp.]|nr:RtcB family protein [Pyramidobacter sp.]
MITISSTCGTAKIFTDIIDPGAEGLLRALCATPLAEGASIRVMPDVHAGKGCAVGTTMTYADKIAPGLVGVDIGCGVTAFKVKCKRLELQKLDRVIRERVPSGAHIRREALSGVRAGAAAQAVAALHANVRLDKALLSLGTLGGGNHFIELDRDEEGALWLLVHSGSRRLGVEVEKHHHEIAFRDAPPEIPYELAWLTGEAMERYLSDMEQTCAFASLNREAILDEIVRGMKMDVLDRVESCHNYVDARARVLRKGAISAGKDERVIIPLNMRDGALLGTGRGNADWNCSAPHGAGRLKSRAETLSSTTVSQFKKAMEGIFTTCVSRETLDESPMAYKPAELIAAQVEPTVEVTGRLHPLYSFKAGNAE